MYLLSYIPLITIALSIYIYWKSKFDSLKEKSAQDIDNTRQRYEVMINETKRKDLAKELQDAIRNDVRDWQPVKNPFSCFIRGNDIVISYTQHDQTNNIYVSPQHAKELWLKILTQLIESGELSTREIKVEEKQAMVDAVQKIKS